MNNEIEELAKIIQQEPFLGGIVGYEERIAKRLIVADYRKQRVGRWAFSEDGKTMKCTVCRLRMKTHNVRRFCPNCGARMEGNSNA